MHPIFWIKDPLEPAKAPRRWSYSALTLWRRCPRRWWLQNCRYDAAPDGVYPMVFGPASIQGRLVHAALEAERKWRRQHGTAAPFQVRRFLKQALRELMDGEIALNPRLHMGRLEASISLDDCLAKYFGLLSDAPMAVPAQEGGRNERGDVPKGPPRDAEEYWLEVEDPPLAGRIDRIRLSVLVDFKTGEEDVDTHGEQLTFYAALWWLRFGEIPSGLELRYAGAIRPLPPPDEAGVRANCQNLKNELENISTALTGVVPARPAKDTCTYCPVRQLCNEYWTAPGTRPMRTRTEPDDASPTAAPIRDVELTALPAHWEPGKPLTGEGEAREIGRITLNQALTLCPERGSPRPSGARLLNVLLLERDGTYEVRTTNATEVFWTSL